MSCCFRKTKTPCKFRTQHVSKSAPRRGLNVWNPIERHFSSVGSRLIGCWLLAAGSCCLLLFAAVTCIGVAPLLPWRTPPCISRGRRICRYIHTQYLSIYRSIDLSIDRSIDLSIYRSIDLSIDLSIDRSIYLFTYIYIYVYIYTYIYIYM